MLYTYRIVPGPCWGRSFEANPMVNWKRSMSKKRTVFAMKGSMHSSLSQSIKDPTKWWTKSTTQQISESENQWSNCSRMYWVNGTVNQQINTNQATNGSTTQTVNQWINQSVNQWSNAERFSKSLSHQWMSETLGQESSESRIAADSRIQWTTESSVIHLKESMNQQFSDSVRQ